MNFQKVSFNNASGQKLAARLDLTGYMVEPIAYALFAHCFTCSKDLKAVGNISRALTQRGIAVLRFDFTGLGESEGDFADTNFSSNVSDLVSAAEFMAQEYQAPQILIGHSLGGAAVLQAAAHISSSVAVATIGAPCNPQHVTRFLSEAKEQIEIAKARPSLVLAGRKFKIKKQFLDDLEETNMNEVIQKFEKGIAHFSLAGR